MSNLTQYQVIEKVMMTQLLDHCGGTGCLRCFRADHSTVSFVTNDLLLTSDHGLLSILVLVNPSAAFDPADHSILLQTLENVIVRLEGQH